ncbi:hypothetical protein O5D80_006391 [Batrachochytrium dendrobatidis]|nr:hypothetical protein O5D80_006391 [Batrachochytrium dendrobatidis]
MFITSKDRNRNILTRASRVMITDNFSFYFIERVDTIVELRLCPVMHREDQASCALFLFQRNIQEYPSVLELDPDILKYQDIGIINPYRAILITSSRLVTENVRD